MLVQKKEMFPEKNSYSEVVVQYVRYLELNQTQFPSVPHFKLWCRENDYLPTDEEIEDIKPICENAILNMAIRSCNSNLLNMIFGKLLEKYHGYNKKEEIEKIPNITINIDKRESENKEITVQQELAKIENNRFN